jgi:hypothetical protein
MIKEPSLTAHRLSRLSFLSRAACRRKVLLAIKGAAPHAGPYLPVLLPDQARAAPERRLSVRVVSDMEEP